MNLFLKWILLLYIGWVVVAIINTNKRMNFFQQMESYSVPHGHSIKFKLFVINFYEIFYRYFFCSSIPKRNEVKRKIIRKSVAVKNEKHFWVKEEYNFSSEWHIKHGCEVAEDKGMHPTRKNILNFIVGISIGILVDKRRYGKVEGGGFF